MKAFFIVLLFTVQAFAASWPDLSQVAKDHGVKISKISDSAIQLMKGARLVRMDRVDDFVFKVNGKTIDLQYVKDVADLRAQMKAALPRKTAFSWIPRAYADDGFTAEDDALLDAMIACVHMASTVLTCDKYVTFVKACLTDAQSILEVPRTQQPQVLYDRLYKMGQQVANGETAIFHSVSTAQQDADFFHQCSCKQDHHSPCSNDYAGSLVKGYAQCIDDFNKMKSAVDLKNDYDRITAMSELFRQMSAANSNAQAKLHLSTDSAKTARSPGAH